MPPKQSTISVRPDALKDKSVIITGEIAGLSRKAAELILIDAGAKIEKSLNKKVQLVVLGENAGPSKMEKIERMGLPTSEWSVLIERIKSDGDWVTAGAGNDDAGDAGDEAPKAEKSAPAPKVKAESKKKEAAPKKKASQVPSSSSSSETLLSGKNVIITGTIPSHDRKSAHSILENAGAHIEKSLNKQVQLVILGHAAGPEKLKKIEDMSLETITWEELAPKLSIEVAAPKAVPEVEMDDTPDSIEGMTIMITGTIEGITRAAAQKLLEGKGAKYAKSLNKSVQLVVLGSNPGPEKLSKIKEMRVRTCGFEELVQKLGIDGEEVEPPKKRARRG